MLACIGILIAGFLDNPADTSGKLASGAGLSWQTGSESTKTQTASGAGNQKAIELSRRSPIIQSAYRFLIKQVEMVKDLKLRKETLDAITNRSTCIQHRVGLTEANENRILQRLVNAGLVDSKNDVTFPGGLRSGVFPPVINQGSRCPRLPQTFFSAPGSDFGGHHSYPGGLVVHEANNEVASRNLANQYRRLYGYRSAGLPKMGPELSSELSRNGSADIFIDQDIILAAPIWHDWAKSIVFQWNGDGSEFLELSFGGNGITDNNGASGNSMTGAHHILGIAEAMARDLSPVFVVTQASAHSAPSNGNEFKVVNWLRAAAIIAQIDPVQKGYLTIDINGHLRLPPVRRLGDANLLEANPSVSNLLVEYTIHNLSDADFNYSSPAVSLVEIILQQLAPDFGVNAEDKTNYNTHFRNPILTYLTAERLLILYSEKGLRGVNIELQRLRQRKII
jgi:hypothetical protein